jgi:penicillin amidase
MKNWDEFRDAASTFIAISQNIVYADKEGNIGMQTTAGIPLRTGNPYLVYPGDTSLYDWKSIVAFSELPRSFNPPSGYLASANNRTIDEDYPYYISQWFDLPNRYEQIEKRLSEQDKLGIDDFESIQADVYSPWAEKLLPWMLGSIENKSGDAGERIQEAIKYLRDWDYRMDLESVAATLFEKLYLNLLTELYKDELGDTLFGELLNQDLLAAYHLDKLRSGMESEWIDNTETEDRIEETGDIVLKALEGTLAQMEELLGREMEEWKWGRVHTLTLEHPLSTVDAVDRAFRLSRGPFPVPFFHLPA